MTATRRRPHAHAPILGMRYSCILVSCASSPSMISPFRLRCIIVHSSGRIWVRFSRTYVLTWACGAARGDLVHRPRTSASSPCARPRFRAQLRRIGVHVQHDLSCSRSSSRLRVHDYSDYRDIPGCAALQLICSFVHVGSGAGGGRGRGVGVAESQLARWPLAAIRVWLRSFLGSRGFGESPSRKLPASRRHSLPTPSRARAAAAERIALDLQ